MEYAKPYIISSDEDWYCDFQNNCFDFAILDEFKANKSIQWMNSWLEGARMKLKKKGLAAGYVKTHNLPTIVCSNYSLEECYHKVAQFNPAVLDALKGRFKIIEVTTFINVFV